MLGLMIEANGWVVALALVIVVGVIVLFWRRTGRIETGLGTIEMTSTTAAAESAKAATVAIETAARTEHVAEAVGSPNGSGPLAQMIESVLTDVTVMREGQAGMALRLADFEHISRRRHEENAARIAALGARVSEVSTRLDQLGAPQEAQ